MEFKVLRTSDLSREQVVGINDLFCRVFDKERSVDEMLAKYELNAFGYSYVSFFEDEGVIHGSVTFVPGYFMVNGVKKVFAYSIDSMVDKDYRDLFEIMEITNNAYAHLKAEGVSFYFGYPNDNSYPFMTRAKLAYDIGKLDTYVLPYRIGGVKPGLKGLNWLSRGCSRVWCWLSGLLASRQVALFAVHKDESSFNGPRYRWFDDYGIVTIDDFTLYYRIVVHEHVRTAFIVDINKKSARNFQRSVSYLLKHESSRFDIILYVGHLPFGNTGLVKIPLKRAPKHFNFVGFSLAGEDMGVDMFDIANWDTNLSNYDLI